LHELRPHDYERHAPYYDHLELDGTGESPEMNAFLHRLFRRRGVRTVLDMTCGTGAQSIDLARRGYRVTASDLSPAMLAEARRKARGLGIRFRRGDMRTVRHGRFDAAISIFNAVGHLAPDDFERAMRNVRRNLGPRGLYVFDILNLEFMRRGGFKSYPFFDVARTLDGSLHVRLNMNRLDRRRGVMHVRQRLWIQRGLEPPTALDDVWDMQLYTVEQLAGMLERAGFVRARLQGGPRQRRFDPRTSPLILIAAERD
jgi:SAM-dependent methyltransferase